MSAPRRSIVSPRVLGFALLGAMLLAVAAVLLGGCSNEPEALSSADKLFQNTDSSSSSAQGPGISGGSQSALPSNPSHPRSAPATVLVSGSRTGARVVAIAFEMRANPGVPSGVDTALIEALRTDQVSATFFVAGLWAQAHPDVIREIAKTPGFELGNGGYSAEYLRMLPVEVLVTRTERAQQIIHGITGITPRIFRPARPLYDTAAIDAIARLGLRPVSGDVDLTDVSRKVSSIQMANDALAKVSPGSIIVLPADGTDPRTTKVFVRLLGGLKRQGYGLVSVSDLR